jgi:hypothetical protein
MSALGQSATPLAKPADGLCLQYQMMMSAIPAWEIFLNMLSRARP